MTREELKAHCKKEIEMCEVWAIGKGEKPGGKIYEEHKLVLELLEQEPKTGQWIEENINEWSRKVFCSECGCPSPFEHVSNGDIYSASGHGVSNKTKYCPNCGAKMVEPQESKDA